MKLLAPSMLVLGCFGRDGLPTESPLLAAIPLTRQVLRRASQLTRLCSRYELDYVTSSAYCPEVRWEFAPQDQAVDLHCIWTAIGVLHNFTLYGRLLDFDDPDERFIQLATTVTFDATEMYEIARQRTRWDARTHDDDEACSDLHRRICARAETLFGE